MLDFNNTFLGRFMIGPLVMFVGFVGRDMQLIGAGDRDILRAWLHHLAGSRGGVRSGRSASAEFRSGSTCSAPISACRSSTCGLSPSIRRTRSPGGRTVIVEASPVFGLLFLNNNLHYVHHENPRVPWYNLPALYRANRAAFLAANGSYSFQGYSEMLRRYLFRAKTPVPHPFLRRS